MSATRQHLRQHPRGLDAARLAVGLIWLAGATFNLLVTLRMERPFAWLEASPVSLYRWFFGEVAGAHPTLWILLLVAGETLLGVLTLARGARAWLGLAGGALFSAFLFSLATPYTLVMGPYALFLGWLARRSHARAGAAAPPARPCNGGRLMVGRARSR